MQNKGFVKVFAVLLTLVCVFYLSFSFVTRHYTNKAKEIANGDPKVEQDYLDSLSNEKVMLWNWTLKQCREMEISLGLDLKGGMNVILEVPYLMLSKHWQTTSLTKLSTTHWRQLQNRLSTVRMMLSPCSSENTTKLLRTQNFPNFSQHNS